MAKDYYAILGVDRNAGKKEIKMAYKKLAREFHPDVAENKEEAEKKFREINEAYSILSDDEKKNLYDTYGDAGIGAASAGYGSPFGGFGFGGFEDMFESIFNMGMGGIGGTRTRARRQNQPVRGSDVRYDLEIDLEQAYKGDELTIDLETFQKCPVCNGRRVKPGASFTTCATCQGSGVIQSVQQHFFGQLVSTSTCSKCKGEGQIPDEYCEECNGAGKTRNKRKITVKIPPGIDSENRIRVPGEGEAGEFAGPAGDLYVFIYIKPHNNFKRSGKDLLTEIPIGFADAALGTSREIETFDGTVKVDIREGTQSEDIITLKGKGMPDLHGGNPGDIYVRIKVVTPTKLSKKQKEILKQFAEAGPQFQEQKKGIFAKILDAFTGK